MENKVTQVVNTTRVETLPAEEDGGSPVTHIVNQPGDETSTEIHITLQEFSYQQRVNRPRI